MILPSSCPYAPGTCNRKHDGGSLMRVLLVVLSETEIAAAWLQQFLY
jgi:hypothetical protein